MKWGKPQTIESGLNTEFDEGACCFSPDQRVMYLTQCTTDPSYPRYATIVTSNRSDAAWSKGSALEISKDTLSSYAHPAVSPDGLWLYFVSDMPGGMGGLDIWRARLTGAGLGGVENLGKPINTEGDEMFPIPSQRRPVFFEQRTSRHGRSRHLHRQGGQRQEISLRAPRLSAQLAGRRLRYDLRGPSQPRFLLQQPWRRTWLGSYLQF